MISEQRLYDRAVAADSRWCRQDRDRVEPQCKVCPFGTREACDASTVGCVAAGLAVRS